MQIHRGRIEGANHSEEQGLGSGILQALAAEGWLTVHLASIKRLEVGPADGTPADWSLYEAHEAENKAHGLMNLDGS